jgi:hypothetical protein
MVLEEDILYSRDDVWSKIITTYIVHIALITFYFSFIISCGVKVQCYVILLLYP